MEPVGIVYLITNKINGKMYVGQTTYSLEKRWKEHCFAKLSRKHVIHKAIEKYGKDNFEIKELAKAYFNEALDDLETYYIKKYNTIQPNGYNLESGGNKNKKLHKSTILKIKNSNSGWNCKQPGSKKITCLEIKTGVEKSYLNQGMAELDGFYRSSIARCCKGLDFSHRGYRWKKAEDESYPNVEFKRTPTGIRKNIKPVKSLRLENKFYKNAKIKSVNIFTGEEKVFPSLKEAQNCGYCKSSILRCVSGERSVYKDMTWSYYGS